MADRQIDNSGWWLVDCPLHVAPEGSTLVNEIVCLYDPCVECSARGKRCLHVLENRGWASIRLIGEEKISYIADPVWIHPDIREHCLSEQLLKAAGWQIEEYTLVIWHPDHDSVLPIVGYITELDTGDNLDIEGLDRFLFDD